MFDGLRLGNQHLIRRTAGHFANCTGPGHPFCLLPRQDIQRSTWSYSPVCSVTTRRLWAEFSSDEEVDEADRTEEEEKGGGSQDKGEGGN